MGIENKARNTAEDLQGKVKEGWGKLTDDERLEAEGRLDQAQAKAKKAGEELADGINDALRRD